MPQNTLVLASGSPRRQELLEQAGLIFEVVPAKVEETLDLSRPPEDNAKELAFRKAEWTARRQPGTFVLGADTLVVIEGQILGKPRDPADALQMLSRLSGRPHQVITGVVILDPEGRRYESAVTSTVVIKTLTPAEIQNYVETGEPLDKAGAYAIQGRGAALVDSWSGSYTNIVGLPMEIVKDLLRQAGFTPTS